MFGKHNIANDPKDFKGLRQKKDGSAYNNSWPFCSVHKKHCQPLDNNHPFGPVVCPDCYRADPDRAFKWGAFSLGHWKSFGHRVIIDAQMRRDTRNLIIWRPWPQKPETKVEYIEDYSGPPMLSRGYAEKQRGGKKIEPIELAPCDCLEFYDLPRSREAGKAAGSRLYFDYDDGAEEFRPCEKGHISPRWVSSGRCKTCNDEIHNAKRDAARHASRAKQLGRGIRKLPHQYQGDVAHIVVEPYIATGRKMQTAIALNEVDKESGKALSKNPHARSRRNNRAMKKWRKKHGGG